MDGDFSQIVKVRHNKDSGDYSISIPFDLRGIAQCKYMECRVDPTTGGILYIPLKVGV